jgi:hypothetical protein
MASGPEYCAPQTAAEYFAEMRPKDASRRSRYVTSLTDLWRLEIDLFHWAGLKDEDVLMFAWIDRQLPPARKPGGWSLYVNAENGFTALYRDGLPMAGMYSHLHGDLFRAGGYLVDGERNFYSHNMPGTGRVKNSDEWEEGPGDDVCWKVARDVLLVKGEDEWEVVPDEYVSWKIADDFLRRKAQEKAQEEAKKKAKEKDEWDWTW